MPTEARWEKHKPGVIRLYGEAVRATVYRSTVGGHWVWALHTIGRHAHTTEVAMGKCSSQRMAKAAGEALVHVYSRTQQPNGDPEP